MDGAFGVPTHIPAAGEGVGERKMAFPAAGNAMSERPGADPAAGNAMGERKGAENAAGAGMIRVPAHIPAAGQGIGAGKEAEEPAGKGIDARGALPIPFRVWAGRAQGRTGGERSPRGERGPAATGEVRAAPGTRVSSSDPIDRCLNTSECSDACVILYFDRRHRKKCAGSEAAEIDQRGTFPSRSVSRKSLGKGAHRNRRQYTNATSSIEIIFTSEQRACYSIVNGRNTKKHGGPP